MKLADYKKLFFKSEKLHLNNAGLSPMMKPALDEVNYWAKRFHEDGYYSDHDYMARVDWTRQQIVNFVDCDKDQVAFFSSCSGGISQFAFGIGLRKDDEVILFDQEYSSNLYPWQQACKKADANLVVVQSFLDKSMLVDHLISKITSKTKVITISQVQYQTGILMDLEKLSEVCREKNIHLFVDAIQGLGIHPISFRKLELAGLVGGSFKWLNGPVGVGFLVLKKELVQTLPPLSIGSGTFGSCDDPSDLECSPKRDASRFEPGSKQVLEICALGRCIETVQQVGVETLKAEAFRLAEVLKSEIRNLKFKVHENADGKPTQFINFQGDQPAKVIQKFLIENEVHVPVRGPGVRVTPHAFNSEEDIASFIRILKKF